MLYSPNAHLTRIAICAQRAALAVALITAALVAAMPTAMAHSDLASSTPADGTTVRTPVSQIELVFANPIDFDNSSFEVVDGVGDALATASVSIADDDRTVTIVVDAVIYQGAVGVGYTIVANDSHPRTGSITFAVDAPTPAPTPTAQRTATPLPPRDPAPTSTAQPDTAAEPTAVAALAAPPAATPTPTAVAPPEPSAASAPAGVSVPDSPPDLSEFLAPPKALTRMIDAKTIASGLGYGAGVLLLGGFFFTAFVAGVAPTGLRRRTLQVAGIATALSGLLLVALQAGIARGGDSGALVDLREWPGVLRGSFGVGVVLRVVGGLGVVAAMGMRRLSAIGAALVGSSFPLLGHGASRNPTWLVFPADLVHVVVVSLWTGGLLMLVLELRRRRPMSVSAAGTPVSALVERFSALAGVAVAAAAMTGIVLAATELATFGELFSTTYGKRLVIKSGLVAIIVALGAVHRFRLIPKLRRAGSGADSLRKIVQVGTVEILLMSMVVVVTTLLVRAAG